MNTPIRRALVITDMIEDFVDDGAIPVIGGREACRRVSRYLRRNRRKYALVVLVRERHRNPGSHFASNLGVEPDFRDTWPDHGVDGTKGAEFPPELEMDAVDPSVVVFKGEYAASYDGFEGASEDPATGERVMLADILRNAGITHVDHAGIAWEYCILATVRGSVAAGFETTALVDLCAAVNSERIPVIAAEMARNGIDVALSADVFEMAAAA